MEIAFKKKNKTILVRVVGEIDHHTAKELRTKTENATHMSKNETINNETKENSTQITKNKT